MNQGLQPAGDMRFEGGAFHPDLEGGRAFGTLRLDAAGIHFDSAKGSVQLPLEGLVIAPGGASDRLIFFTHPAQPKTSLHATDPAILKHPILAGRPDLVAQIARLKTKKRMAVAVLLGVLLLVFGGIAGLAMSKDAIVRGVANSVPVDWEVRLGDQVFESLIEGERVVKSPEIDAQLAEITRPLTEGIKDSRYPLKFHIVEDPSLNAFAVPGGNVVLHSGLLLAADRPEEVAGVLAHEIAHVTQRHSIRSMISSLGLFAVLQAMIGDASSLLAVIANNSAFLLDRKFSRDFEREADSRGWEYLQAANIDPRGMIEFFKRMEEEERKLKEKLPGGDVIDALDFISTHPGTDERMRTLESKWEQAKTRENFHKFELNYAEFKDSLRSRLHSAPNSKKELNAGNH